VPEKAVVVVMSLFGCASSGEASTITREAGKPADVLDPAQGALDRVSGGFSPI